MLCSAECPRGTPLRRACDCSLTNAPCCTYISHQCGQRAPPGSRGGHLPGHVEGVAATSTHADSCCDLVQGGRVRCRACQRMQKRAWVGSGTAARAPACLQECALRLTGPPSTLRRVWSPSNCGSQRGVYLHTPAVHSRHSVVACICICIVQTTIWCPSGGDVAACGKAGVVYAKALHMRMRFSQRMCSRAARLHSCRRSRVPHSSRPPCKHTAVTDGHQPALQRSQPGLQCIPAPGTGESLHGVHLAVFPGVHTRPVHFSVVQKADTAVLGRAGRGVCRGAHAGTESGPGRSPEFAPEWADPRAV